MIPKQVSAVLARLPRYPGSWAFTRGLNALLVPKLASDVGAALEGKQFRLRVLDAGIAFTFAWQGGRFVPTTGERQADLSIGASAHDFWRLARREEDPDTLFFSRRLSLEGDTELGLLFKNSLDALELPSWLK